MEKTKLTFVLPVLITKQNKRFVAYTPVLDLSTSGKTEKDVKKKFVEMVSVFLEELVEANTVDDVLSEFGWKKVQKKWSPPKVVSSNFMGIKVPAIA
jgi:hypothetical protein